VEPSWKTPSVVPQRAGERVSGSGVSVGGSSTSLRRRAGASPLSSNSVDSSGAEPGPFPARVAVEEARVTLQTLAKEFLIGNLTISASAVSASESAATRARAALDRLAFQVCSRGENRVVGGPEGV
jgi:hypothetical protein